MITINRKSEFEMMFAIILAASIGTFIAIYTSSQRSNVRTFAAPVIQEEQSQIVKPVVSAEAKNSELAKEITTSQISSDGTKQVILKSTFNKDNTQTYDFSTADGSGENEQTIFSKTLDSTKSMSIPFNTWSPDNKYFFIQEQMKDAGTITGVFVFKALGEPFANEEAYLDVTDLFTKRNTGNNFVIATGWASETLIIINTTKPDNTKGPSYWFEAPSKAIIQLSSQF